jgi:hypothetical protein
MRAHASFTLAVLVASMASCSSDQSRPQTHTYDCSGPGNGFGDCTEKAKAQCGSRGCNIVSQTDDAAAPSGSGTTEMKRTLVVSCK